MNSDQKWHRTFDNVMGALALIVILGWLYFLGDTP